MKIKNCKLIDIHTCEKTASIVDVAKEMKTNKQRHIIVVQDGRPVGIISNVDIINLVVAEGKDARQILAKQIMVSPVETAEMDDDVADAYFKMAQRNTFSCPVTENGKLRSLLTFNEALRNMIQTAGGGNNG